MNYVTILNIQIICFLHETYSQENYQGIYYQTPLAVNPQYYQPQGVMDLYVQTEAKSYRRSRLYKKSKYDRRRSMASSSCEYDHSDSGESQECRCSCIQCEDMRNYRPCCESFCMSCHIQQSQSNLVFVPYPYPLLISKMTTPPVVSTTMMTTISDTSTSSETKTTADPNQKRRSNLESDGHSNEIKDGGTKVFMNRSLNSDNNTKYILTSLRRTKPYWLPKYGIVPIPDRLADKLLSHMRNSKQGILV